MKNNKIEVQRKCFSMNLPRLSQPTEQRASVFEDPAGFLGTVHDTDIHFSETLEKTTE